MASDYIRNADKVLKRETARQARDRRTSHSRGGSGRTSRIAATTTGHQGGWREAEHGFIDSKPVTFALGWGSKEGEVLLADGHVSTGRPGSFWDGGHNHYGKGQGPNANVKDRGMYSGPGA